MHEWITVSRLRNSGCPVQVDDVVYLPEPANPSRRSFAYATERAVRRVFGPTDRRRNTPAPFALMELVRWYEEHGSQEPPFLRQHLGSAAVLRELRRTYWFTDVAPDPFAIVADFPYTAVGYVVLEGGLIEATVQAFDLFRLMHIRQLGHLHDPVVTADGINGISDHFTHHRYGHVLDAAALMTLCCRNNGITGATRATAQVAALTHDALTPAGGDTVKLIDPPAFDEDAHYPELLAQCDWSVLRQRYTIDPALLTATVQGNGVLGTLLDLVDKIAYVARDTDAYLRGDKMVWYPSAPPTTYTAVRDAAARTPYACGIWDAIAVMDGRVVITDAERLGDFLELRALLFRNFYFHPRARYREHVVASAIVAHAYRSGALTREALLTMTDFDLDAMIDAAAGCPFVNHMVLARSDRCHIEVFPTVAAALARERAVLADDSAITSVEDCTRAVNPATHYLVTTGNDVPRPFRDVYPERASHIAALATIPDPIRLYVVEHAEFRAEIVTALREERLRAIAASHTI